jgi:hypothetical protein
VRRREPAPQYDLLTAAAHSRARIHRTHRDAEFPVRQAAVAIHVVCVQVRQRVAQLLVVQGWLYGRTEQAGDLRRLQQAVAVGVEAREGRAHLGLEAAEEFAPVLATLNPVR